VRAGVDDRSQVPGKFDGVARRYDLMVGLNPGYARHLGMSAERLGCGPGARLLDLCCGTGLSTRALVRAYPDAEVVGLDASEGMLDVARRKRFGAQVAWVHGDAMDPRAAGVEGPFDGILMAYGIRNVPDRDTCLTRLRDLLRPGGTLAVHEYSVAGSPARRAIWNAVSLGVIIPAGRITSGSSDIYRYLRRSVLEFDAVDAFEERLRGAGFVDVRTLPMDGWQRGIVHTFLARRPAG
jgi:ubiquinone/menaquinone biosynthesis C-methylase UbiE